MLRLVKDGPPERDAELAIMQWAEDTGRAEYPAPWDALCCETVSLSDLADDELGADPYDALAHDGIDAYTGADTVLDGSHDHALMLVGWALLNDDDSQPGETSCYLK